MVPFGALVRPRRLAEVTTKEAVAAVGLYALLHAGFSLLLWLDGRRPAFGAFREDHYLLQAGLLLILTPAGWALFAKLAARIAGAPFGRTARALGVAVYLPLLLTFVLPDLAVYLLAGFDALAAAMRWYAPVALLASFGYGLLAVRSVSGAGWVRALLATGAGYLAFGIFTSAWLR